MEPVIKARNLYVTYDKNTISETRALKGVDVDIFKEEFLIIYGPSGCGKSTLLYAMSGIEEEIESGEIWYKDKEIGKMNREEKIMYHRHAIGMIFQGYQLVPTLNILDNVALPLLFEGIEKIERTKSAKKMLGHFELNSLERKLPRELSGGQQQRVGIARALINDPEIVLADEPTGNLDSVSAQNVVNTLKDLSRTMKKAVVLVTHESQYFPYADRIIFMKDGTIVDEVKQKSNLTSAQIRPEGFDQKQKDLHLRAIRTISFLGFNAASEEYYRIEEALRNFLEQKMNRVQLFDTLHKPIHKGGVGLYKQKAERLVEEIEEVLEISGIIYGVKNDEEKIARLKIGYLTDWLLAIFHGHMKDSQKDMLASVVKDRVMGKINHAQLENKLSLAESSGGVGLNFHTARNISKRLEVILS